MVPAHQEVETPFPAGEPAAGTASRVVTVASISFIAPADWTVQQPSTAMRAAQFEIPSAGATSPAELDVYYFGKDQGGTAAQNAARWEGEFSPAGGSSVKAKSQTRMINGLKVTVVTAKGTYASGMPGEPTTPVPDSALWGAIVEGAQGNVFLKATGPRETIVGAAEDFDKLLSTLHPVGVAM